ncbi:MAG: RtcB family protein, partial [Candidatus Falkowbacteria bacterium]|nr:RtcB family protein [Candidatus Falkowbacteria bacterium]
YYRKAKVYCEENKIELPDKELSFLPMESRDGQEYWQAMQYCQEFAQANRALMMHRFKNIFAFLMKCEFIDEIWIHHNYAAREKHFGKEVIVHRKGATRAFVGQRGIVPGSMGTPSYIIEGAGNPESFMSCAHGAGRMLGRKEADRKITKEQADKSIGDLVFAGWQGKFDESPLVYKNIEEIIELQKDLAKPVIKLKPLAVMIGH